MLNWDLLLNGQRRKDRLSRPSQTASANGRIELERDYDRILFATPTRRMGDKTQVFPLERNDSVRNRLTHSHEVSSLARSLGIRIAFDYPDKIFIGQPQQQLERCVPALLAAIGLAHDLGNPPFGHQGEQAIQRWFKQNQQQVFGSVDHPDATDFIHFDGNAQTLRLVTRLQILNDSFGLNLTYATLAALIKYPVSHQNAAQLGWKKGGYFVSEQNIVDDIWQQTGLAEGIRHPFTFLMEACDDIAYTVLDAEDIIKKDIASFSDLVDHLTHLNPDDPITQQVLTQAKSKNKEFKGADLSPKELNDVSMQMFRVYAISAMIGAALNSFVDNIQRILSAQIEPNKNLLNMSDANDFCTALRSFDRIHGYQHKSVLELELRGNNYISSLMDMLWLAIDEDGLFSQYAFRRISENYRRIYLNSEMSETYKKAQLLADAISGMTDSYLIHLHDELNNLYG
ncbi:deoxyguanosinetriphosphate triphosphohydrolase family protein [Gayadomonas joobiniege]|uniref:deoxyguanosinetriphosphate triphosphohydrolase family protein n=1 Tax=Gayadomonas joobiniege TaxID=1234606 RepID=UPI0003698E75|nr:dNTP triphosphohydrolase [Gayadomonas joobiniege]